MKKPLVSILINNYNKEQYCLAALKSAIQQSYRKIEIIFFDDNSSDNSVVIIKKFLKEKKFANVKLILNKKKKGEYHVYNQNNAILKAVNKSKGKIICLLDSDDLFKKNKVINIVDFFIKNLKSNIVFDCPIKLYEDKKIKIYPSKYRFRSNKWPYFPPTSCISFRKKSVEKILKKILVNRFNELAVDFRIATYFSVNKKEFHLINSHLTYYRQMSLNYDQNRYKKFLNKNWWKRRNQAFDYLSYLDKKCLKVNTFKFDFIITKLISLYNRNTF